MSLRRLKTSVQGLLFGRRPRLGLAIRTALAAGIAWQLALWLPFAPADTYPYYAPLGAVVGSYSAVRDSLRNSVLSVLGIVAGACVALAGAELIGPGLFVVVAVVFAATLLAGWRGFGDQRSWVLTAALFVLIVGASDPIDYVLAYSGLTLLGGLTAVIVNALLPEVPLAPSRSALERFVTVIADQLDALAEGLRRDEPLSADEWQEQLKSIEPVRETVRTSEQQVETSLRGNLRARRHLDVVQRQRVSATVLDNVASRVEQLTDVLIEVQAPAERSVAMEQGLRLPTAQVLTSLAEGLREEFDGNGVPAGRQVGLRDDVRRLSAAEAAAQYSNDRDRQTAGAVVTMVRRCLGALQLDMNEPDPEAVAPTPWAQPPAQMAARDTAKAARDTAKAAAGIRRAWGALRSHRR